MRSNYRLKVLLLVEGLYEYLQHELVRCGNQKSPLGSFCLDPDLDEQRILAVHQTASRLDAA
jgi:hypothetical protein